MPANPKYLNKSPWHQFAKITAGVIGGYIITALIHLCLPLFLPYPKEVLITSIFTVFMVWCLFLIFIYKWLEGLDFISHHHCHTTHNISLW